MKGWQALPEERCGNCKYGHCGHPKLKKRRVEEHCQYWTAKGTP